MTVPADAWSWIPCCGVGPLSSSVDCLANRTVLRAATRDPLNGPARLDTRHADSDGFLDLMPSDMQEDLAA